MSTGQFYAEKNVFGEEHYWALIFNTKTDCESIFLLASAKI